MSVLNKNAADDFAVIGGDLRNKYLYESLLKDGKKTSLYGFGKLTEDSAPIGVNINNVKYIIGPTPASFDHKTINMAYNNEAIEYKELFKMMNKGQIFFAGAISKDILETAENFGVTCIDILEKQELKILNAIPTAEAAIMIAIQNMPITLHKCRAMVMGYGNIGRILCRILMSFGAEVFAVARKEHDFAEIISNNYSPVDVSEIGDVVMKMDVVFNTVPSVIINDEIMKKYNKDAPYIELASKPYGIDVEKAKEQGINVLLSQSLPGKTAPKTSAEYIKSMVYKSLLNMEG